MPAREAGTSFSAVALGYGSTCARRADGTAIFWGENVNSANEVPDYDQSTVFVAIDADRNVCCGLRSDGSVSCWGDKRWDTRAFAPAP